MRRTTTETTPGNCLIGPQPGPQYAFAATRARIAIIGGAAFGGKMLALDTLIPTPDGWSTIGSLRLGDVVFTERGTTCHVVAVHRVDPRPDSYRLRFDDGTAIEACADHLWVTFTAAELEAVRRRSEAWRAKRRATRPSRANGRRGLAFREMLTERNRRNPPPTKEPPAGTLRTTEDIWRSRWSSRGRANHYVPVCEAIELPDIELPVDPYLLGVWLGDGTECNGSVTTADHEILRAFERAGYPPGKIQSRDTSKAMQATPRGFIKKLRAAGVLGNKHVPRSYLRGSRAQRLALLQGLMDTDGYSGKDRIAFYSTRRCLVEAVRELACSLGHKPAGIIEKRASLHGVDMGPYWMLRWAAPELVFRLERKALRQSVCLSRRRRYRSIIACDPISPKPMRCISVDNPTGIYLCSESFVPTHNTFGLLLEALRNKDVPRFTATCFRRIRREITQPGGLWDEACHLFLRTSNPPEPRVSELKFRWPSGATFDFDALEHEADKYTRKGAQIALLEFDQLETFSWGMFTYMLSRNRSLCGVPEYVRANCNPDPDSWLREFLSWWIDEKTGYAIPERSGVIRYYVMQDDHPHWADSEAELIELFGPGCEPQSVTFIPSRIQDNKIGMARNPRYLGVLKNLPLIERERLLYGNWNIRATAGTMFRREWLPETPTAPEGPIDVRGWDLAATSEEENRRRRRKSSETATVRMRYVHGNYYILHAHKFRGTPGQVRTAIRGWGDADGPGVLTGLPQDPGQAGKSQHGDFAELLDGLKFHCSPESGSKEERANGLSTQAQAGKVFVVAGPWNEMVWRAAENFPESGRDIIDAASRAYMEIQRLKRGVGRLPLVGIPEVYYRR